eukprot:497554-Prorocentrum_minimum.AAC.2
MNTNLRGAGSVTMHVGYNNWSKPLEEHGGALVMEEEEEDLTAVKDPKVRFTGGPQGGPQGVRRGEA